MAKRRAEGVPVTLDDVLRGFVSSADWPPDERLRVAWQWVEQERDWYARHGKRARNWLGAAQVVAIVLSGLTPILIAWDGLSPVLQALPAALAAIILGGSTVFGWRENWVRFKQTAAALEREQLLFSTRTAPYDASGDGDVLVARFVENASRIVSNEYGAWGQQQHQAPLAETRSRERARTPEPPESG